MIAPILQHVAQSVGSDPAAGTSVALWICLALSATGALIGVGLYLLGAERPPSPALEQWRSGTEPGWISPPLFAGITGRATESSRP
jgi:hypothetical protein